MQFATGSYVGDGNDNRNINDPGFQPDLVIIRSAANDDCTWHSSDMSADSSLQLARSNGTLVNRIQSLIANGFQIGSNVDVNENGTTYHWAAFRNTGGNDFFVGTYVGDGNDNRSIAGIGFLPTIVWVQGDGNTLAVWRIAENAGDDSMYFDNTANVANRIQALEADGFQVGTASEVNTLNDDYFYVAFMNVAGEIDTGNYTGDGNDDRDILDANFQPDLVFVKGDVAEHGVLRTDTFAGDSSVIFESGANPAANMIQGFEATGFEIGTSARVNTLNDEYYWAAWQTGTTSSTSTSTLSSSSSSSSQSSSTSSSTSTSTTSTSTSSSSITVPPIVRVERVEIVSHTQSNALSFSLWRPAISSYVPRGTLITDSLASQINGYSQVIKAIGGYWTSRFSVNYSLVRAEDWIDRLGYHFEAYSPSLVRIWEGFVNKVTLNVGPLSVVRGPLVDIVNRIKVEYSIIDTSTSPPTFGRDDTGIANNTNSQDRYGIIEKIIGASGRTAATALDQRDTWLAENALPETGHQFNSSGRATPSITVELLGYIHWLALYVYNQTTNTGTQEAQQKIEDILDADPNSLFTDFSGIETPTNPVDVKRWENDDNEALGLVKSIVSLGDEDNVRWLFGIYNDRRAEYRAVTDEIKYQQKLSDQKQRTETLAGDEVKPWEVLPGYWLQYTDLLVGRSVPPERRDDSRMEFLESVTFTAPWGLSHSGSKVGTLNQKLAKLGLGTAG